MTAFGSSLADYVRFERLLLWLILPVGLARLALSLAGLSNDIVKWFSMTVVELAGVLYCGIAVPAAGFVEPLRPYAIELRKVRIEHDSLTSAHYDSRVN
jgi:hypothetical protein